MNNITPPFGYREIVAFEKNQRVRFPAAGETPPFCRETNALPISFSEFPRVARDYPIVFSSSDNGRTHGCAAVLGLQAGQNLFLDAGGAWDRTVYLPAYVRRYPFCMTRITVDGVEKPERMVCVAKDELAETGEALFGEDGEALPRWSSMFKLLQEFETDLERTREMCDLLRDYGLFEPFTMQAELNRGGAMQLTGMFRVDEKKLELLTAEQLRTLIRKGMLGRIYAHLLSLENFARLLDRHAAQSAERQRPLH